MISGWVRGLSDRDIEALLAEALGPEAALSKLTASRICRRLRDDFEVFRSQDLCMRGASKTCSPSPSWSHRHPIQDAEVDQPD